jgi:hypothetical protein
VRHGDGCGLIVTGSSKCASCDAGTGLTCASAGKLTTGGHVDIEDGRQFGLVPHGIVVTPSFIHLTGPKVTELWALTLIPVVEQNLIDRVDC